MNSKSVRRLMRKHGLSPKQRRRYVATTDSDHDEPIFPNLAAYMAPDGPNRAVGGGHHRPVWRALECRQAAVSIGNLIGFYIGKSGVASAYGAAASQTTKMAAPASDFAVRPPRLHLIAAVENGVPTLVEARSLTDGFHAMIRRRSPDLDQRRRPKPDRRLREWREEGSAGLAWSERPNGDQITKLNLEAPDVRANEARPDCSVLISGDCHRDCVRALPGSFDS